MSKKIIKNKEILRTYWNNNLPCGEVNTLLETGKFDKNLATFFEKHFTCGFVVAKDVETKEVNFYFGFGITENKEKAILFILEYGFKIKKPMMKELMKFTGWIENISVKTKNG